MSRVLPLICISMAAKKGCVSSSATKRRRSGEALAATASLACLKVDDALMRAEEMEALEEVNVYLKAHTDEILSCRRMLHAGMMKRKSVAELKAPRMGAGCSRVRHLSKSYLEHVVVQLDKRMDSHLLAQLCSQDKGIGAKLYMYSLAASGDSPLPYRTEADTHLMRAQQAYAKLGCRMRDLILDEQFRVQWHRSGVYSLIAEPEGERFTHVQHRDGIKFPLPESFHCYRSGGWYLEANWDFKLAKVTDGHTNIDVKSLVMDDWQWHDDTDVSPHRPRSLEDVVQNSSSSSSSSSSSNAVPLMRRLGDVIAETEENAEAVVAETGAASTAANAANAAGGDGEPDEDQAAGGQCTLDGSGLGD